MIDLAEMDVLQEIDLRLDAVRRELRAVEAELGDPPFQDALDGEVSAQRELAEAAVTARKALETAASDAREKITREEGRLYGGEVTDPRELQHLQQEIFSLRRGLSKQEDDALAAQATEEEEAAALQYLENLRSAALEHWNARQQELGAERDAIAGKESALQAEVEEQRAQMHDGDLRIYDEHRRERPRVVAATVGGVCGACRLTLPTTIITRARRAVDPIACPACGCIVFVS